MFPSEGEEPCPLVLPDSGPRLAGDDEVVTVWVTVQGPQEVPHCGAPQLSKLAAGLVTAVTFLAGDPPGGAGERRAPVGLLLHRDIVQEAGEGAGGGGGVRAEGATAITEGGDQSFQLPTDNEAIQQVQ